jgi:hypothetical protein
LLFSLAGISDATPVPDIEANNVDEPFALHTSDTLSITVSLNSGSSEGMNADWWVAADTPFGWHYYVCPYGWYYAPDLSNIQPAYQGPLFSLSPMELLNMTGLPTGTYTIYCGVDTITNGQIDWDHLYHDGVIVYISSGDYYPPPPQDDPNDIKLIPNRHTAQTNGCIDLYAEVHDAEGELLNNIPVFFINLSEPHGVILDNCGGIEIQTPVNTDAQGRAKITLMSTTPGFITVLAQATLGSQPRERKTVLFSQCDAYECSVLAPSVHLNVDSVPGNGIYNEASDFIISEPPPDPDNTVELLATVRDINGIPIQYNAHVMWGADHEEALYLRTETWTNEYGQAAALVEFTPTSLRGAETHVNVWVYSDNVSSLVNPFDIVTFFLQPVSITSIVVSADQSVVAPEGTADITATVWLNTGDLAPDGVPVIFTTCDAATCTNPCGSIEPFAQTTGGKAIVQFTAPAMQNTCRIKATANSMTGSISL